MRALKKLLIINISLGWALSSGMETAATSIATLKKDYYFILAEEFSTAPRAFVKFCARCALRYGRGQAVGVFLHRGILQSCPIALLDNVAPDVFYVK